MLDAAATLGYPYVILLTHPQEYIKPRSFRYDNLRPNSVTQERLWKVAEFLATNSARFDVTSFRRVHQGLDPNAPPEPEHWPVPTGSRLQATVRSIENFLNDRI